MMATSDDTISLPLNAGVCKFGQPRILSGLRIHTGKILRCMTQLLVGAFSHAVVGGDSLPID